MAWTFYTNGAEKTSLSTVPNNAARAKTAVAQSQGSGTTYATLALELEDYDYGGLHSNVTNNSRLTASVDGVYLIEGIVNWATSTSGDRSAAIRLNGTTNIATSTDVTQSTAALLKSSRVSTHYYLTAGQYVELRVFQNSGGALGLDTTNPSSLSMALVSPLSGGGGGGGGATTLDGLSDVDTTAGLVDGSLLRYELTGTEWRNTTSSTLLLNDAGQLQVPTVGATGGLLIGGDTNLYRQAADRLSTDDFFVANRPLITDNAVGVRLNTDANHRVIIKGDGSMLWGDGTSGGDTLLSWSAANTLAMGSGDKIQQSTLPIAANDLTNQVYVDRMDMFYA